MDPHECCMRHCWDGNMLHFKSLKNRPSALFRDTEDDRWSDDAVTTAGREGHFECMKILHEVYSVKPDSVRVLTWICAGLGISALDWCLSTFPKQKGLFEVVNDLSSAAFGKQIQCFDRLWHMLPEEARSRMRIQTFGVEHLDVLQWEILNIRCDKYPGAFDDCAELQWIDHELYLKCTETGDYLDLLAHVLKNKHPVVVAWLNSIDEIIDRECLSNVGRLQRKIWELMKPEIIEVVRDCTKISADVVQHVLAKYL